MYAMHTFYSIQLFYTFGFSIDEIDAANWFRIYSKNYSLTKTDNIKTFLFSFKNNKRKRGKKRFNFAFVYIV